MYNKRRFNVLVLFGVAQKFYCCRQSRNTTVVDWTYGEMAEQGEEIELEDRGLKNEEDDRLERIAFEKSLRKTLKEGDAGDIADKLTPRALTKCDTNALLMAMEVNFELRRLADKKGPDEEEFTKLANSVDEFTNCLLEPLKSNTEARHAFGDSLDVIIEAGIELEQKKFFAHPVLYNLMKKKWWGKFGEIKKYSWLDLQSWTWLFLNLWCLFDLVLFPVLFAVFYIKHRINNVTHVNKEKDLAFALNATSASAKEAFSLMKESIKDVMRKHKEQQVKYQILIHGEDSSSGKICFANDFSNFNALSDSVDQLTRNAEVNIPALHEDLEKISEAFKLSANRPNSEKVLLLFTDHKICLRQDKERVKDQITKIKEMGIKLVPVGIGPHINIRELERINNDGHEIMHFGEYAHPRSVGTTIWHELEGKDLLVSYLEYFTTPYFVFIRDTLSYLALLGLHFALCLEISTISFSSLEWAILVFFLGRILMESRQFVDIKVQRKKRLGTKSFRGSKYEICDENGDDKIKGPKTPAVFLQMCNKYLSDRWNILDFITLLVYAVTFLLRIITWSLSESVTDNRALVISGYLYGLNTMLLTLRAFGHVMETVKKVGAIQIALFHIIGDVATIFWQFIATILAFSIAITKVYMAERSFISSNSGKESACKTSGGLACWWSMVKHLTWSLLGIAELDPLDSVDSASVTLAHFLFGVFLIMGVILLVNMMIALLSNTYQRVEDNSLKEWSYKKAITIQTYSTYHPIPVPLNLVSHLFMFIRWLWRMCKRGCKGQPRNNTWRSKGHDKSLDAVVENLQLSYFSTYGYSFPLTDERKMDHVLQETERNRQMANQIAHRTFTARGFEEGIFPTGAKAWQSQGIRVQGCLLTCEGSEYCSTCKDDPAEYHGARYRFPFSPENPHFEVLIQETGERRLLGVGVVEKDYGNHALPGWLCGTVGYHIDDGRIFDATNPKNGVEYEDAMAYRGDLIGCTVKFDSAKDGKVPIVFSLNGRQITQDEITMEYVPNEKSLYPYIGMGHAGMRVLAKMCSYRAPEQGLKKHEIQDDDQLVGEELDSILKTLEEMGNKFRSAFHRADNSIGDVQGEIEKSNGKLYHLVDDILSQFERFEKEMKGELPLHNLCCSRAKRDDLTRLELAYLCKKDTKENPTNLELIKEIKEKTKELERMTDEKFTVLFDAFQQITNKFQGHTQYQERLIGNIQKRFNDHKKFIRSHLPREEENVERSLNELEANLSEKLSALDNELQEIHSELDESGQESERLKRSINCEFTEIRENIISRDWRMRFKQPDSPVFQPRKLECFFISSVRMKTFQGHGMASYDALKGLIDDFNVILNEGFDSASKRLTEIKDVSKQHTHDLNEMKRGFEGKFLELKELIQSNLK